MHEALCMPSSAWSSMMVSFFFIDQNILYLGAQIALLLLQIQILLPPTAIKHI